MLIELYLQKTEHGIRSARWKLLIAQQDFDFDDTAFPHFGDGLNVGVGGAPR